MDGYTGEAVYDPESGTTTITGSITDSIFLYIIPAGTQGTVVLDGTGYLNALVHRYTNSAGKYWNPGSYSGGLPIEEVPLGDLPRPEDFPGEEIFVVDENIPLGDLPQTGTAGVRNQRSGITALLLSVFSLVGAVGMYMAGAKKRDKTKP